MAFEDIRETLKKIGLGHNESKLYLTLVKLGPSLAGKLAKEANIDRSACYDSLKSLIKKGLVNYSIEANRKKFSAENPNRLKTYLKEKETLVDNILPGLKEMFKEKEEKSQVQMYKGKKGIKSVLEDILKSSKNGENLVIDSHGGFTKKMPYYAPHYIKGLEKNKIKVRHLMRKDKNPHPSKTTEIRFFSKKVSDTIITTNIYAGKIALILWLDIPEAVIITNKSAYEAYKSYFEVMWATAKK
ncbi:TrmB family transcriptional regulator [archaeon]|jgi:HTH-type transcriptional regulator, sugar sensing transcriptional regulator|nr:TrmB family transcriptional regulator [archaeon]MBT6820014.1 TrmB family transcriptional regulator [archaeon]MBT6955724.1 TrmB family transcriptional regulator [archaeon]MBT7238670.1 TrmB family transcriptional regulator [archaeon]MBT7567815.1 TrmB family transcriptional regulator [archaeon]